ncbi:DnaT-like ssDNA-binding protein [Halomonas caseinilytica]|uniref:DnaT-like ssDNA-binding protein n=1 Tax=Halomonas caseinilytica TaxID=438744 RepID=UPI0007E56955|nr:DnaT-like ssDNA-binding protein [Halomonas caseinilytica]SEN64982.1 hypothetical protein SAMN04487952_12310 [Halomonas caseinilytica]
MPTYVTKADVDAELGAGWEGTADPERAVRQANVWLSTHLSGREFDTVPAEVVQAGAELARLSAEGTLYADSEGDVKREMVKADTVEVETEFMDGSRPTVGALSYVRDLLRPWLSPFGGSVSMLKRL